MIARRVPTSSRRLISNAAASRPLGRSTRELVIQLTRALTPAEPRGDGWRRAGAGAVLVGPAAQAALPFEVADSKTRIPPLRPGTVSRQGVVNHLQDAGAHTPR